MQVYSYKKNRNLIFLHIFFFIVLQVFDIAGAANSGFQAQYSFSGTNPMRSARQEKSVVQQKSSSDVVTRKTPFVINHSYVQQLQSKQVQAHQTVFSSNKSDALKKHNTQKGSSDLEISGDQTGQINASDKVFTYDNPMHIAGSNTNLVEQKPVSDQFKLFFVKPLSRVKDKSQEDTSRVVKSSRSREQSSVEGDGGKKPVDSAVDVSNAQDNLSLKNIYTENSESVSLPSQSQLASSSSNQSSRNPLSRDKRRSQVSKPSSSREQSGVEGDGGKSVSKRNDQQPESALLFENIYQGKSVSAQNNSQVLESNYSKLSNNLAQLHIKFQDFVAFISSMSIAAKQQFLKYLEQVFPAKSSRSNENKDGSLSQKIVQNMAELDPKKVSVALTTLESISQKDPDVASLNKTNLSTTENSVVVKQVSGLNAVRKVHHPTDQDGVPVSVRDNASRVFVFGNASSSLKDKVAFEGLKIRG